MWLRPHTKLVKVKSRRGFTLLEMAVGALLLGMVMALTVQILAWSASERRVSERRQRALHEASNLIERLATLPSSELNPATLRAAKLSDQTRQALPNGELKVALDEGPEGLKRLTVEIHYRDRAGEPVAPVRLTAFLAERGTPK